MRHPAVRCLSHPKGRIINHRPENALDLDRVFEVALETGVAVEINGLPPRLDLRDVHVRAAIEAGVQIVCSTDAHSVRGLGNMQLSVATARRGWATAANILNTRPLSEIAQALARVQRPVERVRNDVRDGSPRRRADPSALDVDVEDPPTAVSKAISSPPGDHAGPPSIPAGA